MPACSTLGTGLSRSRTAGSRSRSAGIERRRLASWSRREELAMIRKYVLPLLALGLLVFAVVHALLVQRPEPNTPPPVRPPVSPFGDTVAGVGMVEPSTEASGTGNISVGSQLPGTVVTVRARVGQEVKTGAV